jgi:hypothetical protein
MVIWVQLVLDGDDRYYSFPFAVPLGTNNVVLDDLKKSIVVEAKYHFDKDIHSLHVHPPGTKVPVVLDDEGAESLRPGVLLSSSDFPTETTDQTPLIVTAKRSQQVSLISLVVAAGGCYSCLDCGIKFTSDPLIFADTKIVSLPIVHTLSAFSHTPHQKGPTHAGYHHQQQQQQQQ